MKQQYLTRLEAADYVTSHGIPLAKSTLQKMATVGGGPLYCRFGRRSLYKAKDLDTWIKERVSAPRSSTSSNAGCNDD